MSIAPDISLSKQVRWSLNIQYGYMLQKKLLMLFFFGNLSAGTGIIFGISKYEKRYSNSGMLSKAIAFTVILDIPISEETSGGGIRFANASVPAAR